MRGATSAGAHAQTRRRWSEMAWVAFVCALPSCGAPPPAPADEPAVVAIAEPAAAPDPPEPSEPAPEPAPTARPAPRGSCPFSPPALSDDGCSGAVPAAPVLGNEPAAPRPMPPEVARAISHAIDPRLQGRGTVHRATLQSEVSALERQLQGTAESNPARADRLRRLADAQVALAHAAQDANHVAAEQRSRKAAIASYEAFEASYPGHGALAEVRYHRALEHQRLGEIAATRKVLLALVQGAPQSQLVPKAHFLFGELFFVEGLRRPLKLELAAQLYQQAIEYPPPGNPVYGLAHYRLGLVRWHEGKLTRALEAFVKTLDYANRFGSAPEAQALRPAAIDAVVHTFVEVGNPAKACPFLHRFVAKPPDPAATLAALEALGEAYLRRGRRAEAVVIYRTLGRHHRGPERCRDRAVLESLRKR